MTIDPWTEKFNFQSPYVYALNNPVRFTDYMGLGPEDEVNKLKEAAQKGVEKAEEAKGKLVDGKADPACNVGVSTAYEEKTKKTDLRNKTANDIVDYVSTTPDKWAEVNMSEVQDIANEGGVVIAGAKGDLVMDKEGRETNER